ncbi:MAG TPA: hypothetical protein DCY02_09030, partial [Armatimonadetes bacterium]|nr:hypothetical protein [Armatimonadota bacterium]
MSTVWVLAALGAGFASPSTQPGLDIVRNARKQVGVTTSYDPAYVRLSYPGGDVSKNTGVCTDVVVRALRPLGYDLQELIHEDWRAKRPAPRGGPAPPPKNNPRGGGAHPPPLFFPPPPPPRPDP